jgi:hypothetical protein
MRWPEASIGMDRSSLGITEQALDEYIQPVTPAMAWAEREPRI